MNSSQEPDGKFIGLDYLIEEGTALVDGGDNSFMDIEIDPDEFKVLLFTSGTTAAAKAVMLSQYNVCSNINAMPYFVSMYDTDVLLSFLPIHHTLDEKDLKRIINQIIE